VELPTKQSSSLEQLFTGTGEIAMVALPSCVLVMAAAGTGVTLICKVIHLNMQSHLSPRLIYFQNYVQFDETLLLSFLSGVLKTSGIYTVV
jgi:hypothetical protein